VFSVATLDMNKLVEKMGVGESPTNEWCGNNSIIVFSSIVSYGRIQGATEFAVTMIQGGRTLTRSSRELLQFEAYKRKKSVFVKQDYNQYHVGPSLQAGHTETLNDYMDFSPTFESWNVVYYVANSQKVVGAQSSSLQVISFFLSNKLS
jgi:hypothetical protein